MARLKETAKEPLYCFEESEGWVHRGEWNMIGCRPSSSPLHSYESRPDKPEVEVADSDHSGPEEVPACRRSLVA